MHLLMLEPIELENKQQNSLTNLLEYASIEQLF